MQYASGFTVCNCIVKQGIVIGSIYGPFGNINCPTGVRCQVIACIIIDFVFVGRITTITLIPESFRPGGKTLIQPDVGPGTRTDHISKPLVSKFVDQQAFIPATGAN